MIQTPFAAYNAGPDRYEASLAGRPLPLETRAYVAAVAPFIGGGGDAPVMIAAADRFAWTRASLFIVQPDRSTVAASALNISGIMPRSDGLFMAGVGAHRAATPPRGFRPEGITGGTVRITFCYRA